jgi:TRAP-type C4-dicarboxylate transport system permease small subunit
MISKFFILWLALTAVIFGWTWFISKQDKQVTRVWIKRGLVSAGIAVVIIGVLLLFNNISGV